MTLVIKTASQKLPSMEYGLQAVLKIHSGWIKSLDIDPYDALMASSSTDNTVKITDIKTKQLLATVSQKHVCEEVKFSKNHPYIFCASLSGLITCYDLVDREFTREYYGHSSSVLCLDIDKDRIFSGSADCTVRVWDIRSKGSISVMKGHRLPVNDVVFSGGVIYSCSMDGAVSLWDERNHGTAVATFDSSVTSICICGKSLLISTKKGIFEYREGFHRNPILAMENIRSLEGYDDDHYIVGGEGYVIFNAKDGKHKPNYFRTTGSADNLKITSNKESIICGGINKTIEFLERKSDL